jgi:hypothetical protein
MDLRNLISFIADIVTIGTPLVTGIYYIYNKTAKNHSKANKSGSLK